MTRSTRIIVTCGPAYEPLDEVRSITNFSTGALGTQLSDHLAAQGWEIICLRGKKSVYPAPIHAKVLPFSTNSDLERLLQQLAASSPPIKAIFHIAALADFHLNRVEDHRGKRISSLKFSSNLSEIRLILTPAPKIIQKLRAWFPDSKIVGWKYELEGLPADALACGRQQITENKTDACVVNGKAWGKGFAFLEKNAMEQPPIILPTHVRLCAHLKQWLATQLPS